LAAVSRPSPHAREHYDSIGGYRAPGRKADACTECGTCEPYCPQGVPIREDLREARGLLQAALLADSW